ncbi:MAG: serine/threonine-protein phosphatase [Ruminococcus sp.]|nr:serine/threonine-protein phosphatase [Ruminococcus sp.]
MRCEIRSFIGTRSYQEDHAACCESENGLFCAVCDGIGSRKDGGASSRLAAERFTELYKQGFGGGFPAFITEAAERIDREVYESFGSGCGTTAVTVCVKGRELWWLSVGDSRLYILRGGRLKQMTTDHDYSYVLDLRLKKGIIDSRTYEAEKHKGGRLASFIGMGGIDIADVSMKPLTLEKNDMLLLCTDGLYKSIGDGRIAEIMIGNNDPAAAADTLMAAVKGCSGAIDNTTLAVIGNIMEE